MSEEKKEKVSVKFKKHEIALMAGLGVVIIVAAVMLFLVVREYSEGDKAYEDMAKYVTIAGETLLQPTPNADAGTSSQAPASQTPEPGANPTTQPASTSKPQTTEAPVVVDRAPIVDFNGLHQQNPDIVGWIYSAGTMINYPVVQGKDNEEYLYRLANRTNNRNGSIFLDYQNDKGFQDSNSVLNGHNMKNGSMFASLMKYGKQEYYNEHPRIWLVTPDNTYSLELFAGFITTSDSDVWQLTFSTEDDFTNWKSEMAKKSCFKSSVTPAAGEKVVTLSTCTNNSDDERFVVLGVLR